MPQGVAVELAIFRLQFQELVGSSTYPNVRHIRRGSQVRQSGDIKIPRG
jgi:hypothetical protein